MNYIPSKEQRIKVHKKIAQQQHNKQNNSHYANAEINQKKDDRRLSTEEMAQLLSRLQKSNKRQLQLRNTVETLLVANQKNRQRNIQRNKVEERLLEAGKQLQLKKQKLKAQYQKEQESKMREIPAINESDKITEPFLQRIDSIVSQKQLLMRKLNQKYCPKFRPQLNPYSIFIAEVNNYEASQFTKRAIQKQNQRNQKREKLRQEILRKQMQDVTFKPRTNSLKNKGVTNKPKNNKSTDKILENNKQFHPIINRRSSLIANNLNEARKQFHERLYPKYPRQTIQKQLPNFRPSINEHSRQLIKSRQRKQQAINMEQEQFQNQYEQIFVSQHSISDHDDEKLFGDSTPSRQSYQEVSLSAGHYYNNS